MRPTPHAWRKGRDKPRGKCAGTATTACTRAILQTCDGEGEQLTEASTGSNGLAAYAIPRLSGVARCKGLATAPQVVKKDRANGITGDTLERSIKTEV
eukprot:scaffold9942_cov57-Phaeocystis_antarctica.AAC.3